MHVNVDGTGQDMHAARIQRFARRRHRFWRADRMDFSVLDRDAGANFRIRRDEDAAVDDEIDFVRICHGSSPHSIAQPPSTGKSTPVIWRETSLAKNRQALATSSSTVMRFSA